MSYRLHPKISSFFQQPQFTENPDAPCPVLIELAGVSPDRIAGWVDAGQGRVRRTTHLIPAMAAELPFAMLEKLAWSSLVRRIWYDVSVRVMLDVAVPTTGSAQVQEKGFTGKDMVAAIIDTGIAPHPDLVTPENRIIGWRDLVNSGESPYDDNGHGTHVAGTIAGNGRASRGRYRGMAPEAKLVGIKALGADGSGRISDIIAGVEWCIDHQKEYNIKALNLSLGATAEGSFRVDPLCRATAAAWNKGITVCAAAGNGGPELRTINTPGIQPSIITVGNLDDRNTLNSDDDLIYESSSRGPTVDNITKPDLLAPGAGIISLSNRRGYRALTGTSMSTAMVTGSVLQICQKWPNLSPNEIKRKLIQSARSLGLEANQQGAGAMAIAGVFQESAQNERKTLSGRILESAAPLGALLMALGAIL